MELKIFVVNPIQVNCYLLWDETKEAVLIDCGALFPGEREEIKEFINANGLTLKHYLNTHLHFDHIFGNAFIKSNSSFTGSSPFAIPSLLEIRFT